MFFLQFLERCWVFAAAKVFPLSWQRWRLREASFSSTRLEENAVRSESRRLAEISRNAMESLQQRSM